MLSKIGYIRIWNPIRFTENFSTLNSVKFNYPYLNKTCELQSDPQVTLDGSYRGRLIAVKKYLNSFEYMFILFLSYDFLRVMNNLNESFQDIKKSLNELADTGNKTLSVLKNSRTDEYWDML